MAGGRGPRAQAGRDKSGAGVVWFDRARLSQKDSRSAKSARSSLGIGGTQSKHKAIRCDKDSASNECSLCLGFMELTHRLLLCSEKVIKGFIHENN